MKKKLLKIQLLGLALAGFAFGNNASAQNFGQFASAISLKIYGTQKLFNITGSGSNVIGYDGSFPIGADGGILPVDLGTYVQYSNDLAITGAEMKTYKNPGANVCGVKINHGVRVLNVPYPGDWYNTLSLPFKADCSNNTFADGYGPCSGNDQKWGSFSLLTGDLTGRSPGDYELDVYFRIDGSSSNPSDCSDAEFLGSINQPIKCIFHIRSSSGNKGVNENLLDANAAVRTYPSPVRNVVTIEAQNFDDGPVQMQVTNIQGAVSKSITSSYAKGQNLSLDMSSYAAGMYFVRLQQGSKTAVAKVVKQ